MGRRPGLGRRQRKDEAALGVFGDADEERFQRPRGGGKPPKQRSGPMAFVSAGDRRR